MSEAGAGGLCVLRGCGVSGMCGMRGVCGILGVAELGVSGHAAFAVRASTATPGTFLVQRAHHTLACAFCDMIFKGA